MTRISSQSPSNARRAASMGHRSPASGLADSLPVVSVYQHVHDIKQRVLGADHPAVIGLRRRTDATRLSPEGALDGSVGQPGEGHA